MHLIKRIVVIIAALAAMPSLVSAEAQESPGKHSIVGTWQVLRHGVDCVTRERLNPDFPTLITFNSGRTLNGYAVAPGENPGLGSPEYGNWTREQRTQTYKIRDVSYGYDENGAFTGRAEITAMLTLAAGGDSFTADTTVYIYDADGHLLFSFCGMWTGTRFE